MLFAFFYARDANATDFKVFEEEGVIAHSLKSFLDFVRKPFLFLRSKQTQVSNVLNYLLKGKSV